MNRSDFQRLAESRILDAEVLLNGGRWSAAYYLTGYAVECGLKACIAKLTQADDFPDKSRALKCWTHDLTILLDASKLDAAYAAECAANPGFFSNWGVARDWSEGSRYEEWTEAQARRLFSAVADSTTGVLPWIRRCW